MKSSIGVRPSWYMRSDAARRVAWIAAGRSSKWKNSLVLRGMLKVRPETSWKRRLGLLRFDASMGQFSFMCLASDGDWMWG